MKRLIHAELFKARSNRAVWILAAITPAFCALWALLSVSLMNLDSPVPLDQRVENVYNMAQQAYIFTFVLGVLGMTGEYRHQTITWSFLVTPVRGRVVTAKLVAYGLIGLLVAAGSTLVTFGAGAALLAAGGHPMTTPDLPAVLAGTTLSIALYAVFGVALGALIRNQVAAIVVAAVWFVFGDYLLSSLLPELGRWLPTGAARAVGGMTLQSGDLLPAWGGGLLFAAYVVAIVLAARLITLRRDVT
ncbi:ABC transporter permease subunit [Streptosporangium lutulentum]|uniref:ABC-2 type transport system permease protein n=1 Tax=Streptosporangium lutulentum TaxID=1461250 RepID=A0ABT9QBP2_9ACTN|nr:ABC transporter permease subunit [Streptosporangium lutulentum]MDP9844185.1 ABC-2 type transport system permease protein [Streptosporangium lutulentum]